MKKELFDELKYEKVAPANINPLASSNDPLNAGRLPIGIAFTPRPDLVTVPKTERMAEWQAVVLDTKKEVFLTSPRLLAAVGYLDGKLQRFDGVPSVCGTKSVMDFLATGKPIKVSKYQDVQQDKYNSDRTAKPVSAPKGVPVFTLAKPDEVA